MFLVVYLAMFIWITIGLWFVRWQLFDWFVGCLLLLAFVLLFPVVLLFFMLVYIMFWLYVCALTSCYCLLGVGWFRGYCLYVLVMRFFVVANLLFVGLLCFCAYLLAWIGCLGCPSGLALAVDSACLF